MKAVNVNYLSILIVSLINMLIGYVWYSQKFFGKKWEELSGLNRKGENLFARAKIKQIPIYFLLSFFTAHIFFIFSDYFGTTTIGEGAQLGLWIWFGFVLTNSIYEFIFPKKTKSWELFFINNFYILTNLIVMGMILAIWR